MTNDLKTTADRSATVHRTTIGLMTAAGLLVAGGLLGGFATRGVETTDATASGVHAASAEVIAAAHAAGAVNYDVDHVHSHVVFHTTHMGAGRAYGMIHAPHGTLSFDPVAKTVSDIKVTVDVSKIDTGHDGRDEHLRGGDFFSASEFPTMTFASSEVASLASGPDTVSGSITLLGKTVPVQVAISMVGTGTNPRSNKALAGFVAEFSIKRSDFGMTYGVANGALGDEVFITVAIEAAD